MNVTLVPEQIVPEGSAAMLTKAAVGVVTVSVIVFEDAGLPLTQVNEDVITH